MPPLLDPLIIPWGPRRDYVNEDGSMFIPPRHCSGCGDRLEASYAWHDPWPGAELTWPIPPGRLELVIWLRCPGTRQTAIIDGPARMPTTRIGHTNVWVDVCWRGRYELAPALAGTDPTFS